MPDSAMPDAATALDHLLIGARTIEAGIEWLESRTGVRAAMGGSHPGLGTWNALASLGPGQYIEIIAPDPTQPGMPTFYVPRLRDFVEPRVATWAAGGSDLATFVGSLPETFSCMPAREGSRIRPDGARLAWTLAFPKHRDFGNFGGALPFLIDWSSRDHHPSLTAPAGLTLRSLTFAHPDADALSSALRVLGIDSGVEMSSSPSIRVELDTPRGPVVL